MVDKAGGATPETPATPPAATPPATPGATPDSSSATNTKTAGADENKADANNPDGSPKGDVKSILGHKPGEGEGDKGTPETPKPQAAPETYEPFKLPEGFVADETATKEFAGWAKSAGLTQETAQSVVDMHTKLLAQHDKAMQEQFELQKKEWHDASMKQMGPKSKAEMGFIAKARDGFFDDEAFKVLSERGLDVHPALVRAFIKIGKAIADDTVVDGGKGGGEMKTAAEILYPNLPK